METRYEFIYEVNGEQKVCYPKSEEQKNKNLDTCRDKGIKVISCKKLYPFSLNKNQHNFELISNICFNKMHDMENGEAEWNEEEYNYLSELKDKADKYFCLEFPIAWLPYEELKEAKEIATMAENHRYAKNVEAGNFKYLMYC